MCDLDVIGVPSRFVVYYESIKRELRRRPMSVGTMKDLKLKLRDLHVSHTLGCVGDWNT